MEYLYWATVAVGNGCILDSPENVEFTPRLVRGVPYAAGFPADATVRMSKSARKRTALLDDVANTDRIKVCSPRLVAFLRERKIPALEYLPVTILDHKGKVAAKDYSIVHCVGLQDALDQSASQPVWSPIAKTEIQYVKSLVIDPRKVDPKVRIFRLKHFLDPVLVEKGLADELVQAGFQGCFFHPLDWWGK